MKDNETHLSRWIEFFDMRLQTFLQKYLNQFIS